MNEPPFKKAKDNTPGNNMGDTRATAQSANPPVAGAQRGKYEGCASEKPALMEKYLESRTISTRWCTTKTYKWGNKSTLVANTAETPDQQIVCNQWTPTADLLFDDRLLQTLIYTSTGGNTFGVYSKFRLLGLKIRSTFTNHAYPMFQGLADYQIPIINNTTTTYPLWQSMFKNISKYAADNDATPWAGTINGKINLHGANVPAMIYTDTPSSEMYIYRDILGNFLAPGTTKGIDPIQSNTDKWITQQFVRNREGFFTTGNGISFERDINTPFAKFIPYDQMFQIYKDGKAGTTTLTDFVSQLENVAAGTSGYTTGLPEFYTFYFCPTNATPVTWPDATTRIYYYPFYTKQEIIVEALWEGFGFQYPNPSKLNPTLAKAISNNVKTKHNELLDKERENIAFMVEDGKTDNFRPHDDSDVVRVSLLPTYTQNVDMLSKVGGIKFESDSNMSD